MSDIAADIIASAIDMSKTISLTEAAKLMRGRGGRRPSIETVRRWANPNKGARLPGGGLAVLLTVKIGQDILTLPEWVTAFERRRASGGVRQEKPPERPLSRRASAHRRAEKALDKAKVK